MYHGMVSLHVLRAKYMHQAMAHVLSLYLPMQQCSAEEVHVPTIKLATIQQHFTPPTIISLKEEKITTFFKLGFCTKAKNITAETFFERTRQRCDVPVPVGKLMEL